MRKELYADSRDEWKWSVAIRHALHTGQSIEWILMLRPDVGKHGNTKGAVPSTEPAVTTFFARERQHHAQGQPKNLSGVANLCTQLGVRLASHTAPYPSAMSTRSRYFDNVSAALHVRKEDLHYLALCDPDNGIGTSRVSGTQIHVSHLQQIWSALRDGDTLGMVQFQQRIPNWIVTLQSRIAKVLGVAIPQARSFPWGNLCLYLIDR